MAEHPTPWSGAMTVVKYGKWVLGLFALNYYGWLIDLTAVVAVGVIALAVTADAVRTRRLRRQWDQHCQDIADQWVTRQTTPPTTTALPAPEPEPGRWAA